MARSSGRGIGILEISGGVRKLIPTHGLIKKEMLSPNTLIIMHEYLHDRNIIKI